MKNDNGEWVPIAELLDAGKRLAEAALRLDDQTPVLIVFCDEGPFEQACKEPGCVICDFHAALDHYHSLTRE